VKNEKTKIVWGAKRNGDLMATIRDGGTAAEVEAVCRRSPGGCHRQFYAIVQRGVSGDLPRVKLDLKQRCADDPWTPNDWTIVEKACIGVGERQGPYDPEHLASILGRTVEEVKEKMHEVAGRVASFGVGDFDMNQRIKKAIKRCGLKDGNTVEPALVELGRENKQSKCGKSKAGDVARSKFIT
jgi:hypothetical protein